MISLKSKKIDFRVMVFVSKSEFLIEGKDSKKLRVLRTEFYFFYCGETNGLKSVVTKYIIPTGFTCNLYLLPREQCH